MKSVRKLWLLLSCLCLCLACVLTVHAEAELFGKIDSENGELHSALLTGCTAVRIGVLTVGADEIFFDFGRSFFCFSSGLFCRLLFTLPLKILCMKVTVYTATVIFITFTVLRCGTFGTNHNVIGICEDFSAPVAFII